MLSLQEVCCRMKAPWFLWKGWDFSSGSVVKNFLQCSRHGFDPWFRKIPWRKIWQPTPVFLPGESPWTEEPGELQSMGLKRDRYD